MNFRILLVEASYLDDILKILSVIVNLKKIIVRLVLVMNYVIR